MGKIILYDGGKMKKIILIFIISMVFFAYADENQAESILILNSYNDSYNWTQSLMDGIMSQLSDYLDVRVEYLDAKNFNSDLYFEDFYIFIKNKYQDMTFDAIVITDDYALQFVLKHREELFNDIPIFFAGINDKTVYDFENLDKVYGVIEEVSVNETLETALKLNPNIDSIHFVVDESVAGKITYDTIMSELKDLNVTTYKGKTLDEIISEIEKIDNENAIVLLAYYIVDLDGTFYDTSVMTEKISQVSPVPIYGLYEFSFGYGIVGGKLISGYEQGKRVIEILKEYFKGAYKNNHLEGYQVNQNAYDYEIIQKYDLNFKDLPKDSIIINKPLTFYERHQEVIIGGLIIIFILSLYIILLKKQVKSQTMKYLEINQHLYEADKLASLGQMMHRISHELNTPLGNSITTGTYIENSTDKIKDAFNSNSLSRSKLDDYLKTMAESAQLLNSSLDTANELMTAFRIFSEHTEDNQNTKFDFKYYLENLIKTYQSLLSPCGHQIQTFIEDNLIIYGRTQDYYKIFDNLLSNAIEHGFKDLENKVITIKAITQKNKLIIHFDDDGHGIESSNLDQIFEPMYRLNSSKHFVLGLGLVHRIITDLNGSIRCISELNHGTKFIIEVPLKKE